MRQSQVCQFAHQFAARMVLNVVLKSPIVKYCTHTQHVHNATLYLFQYNALPGWLVCFPFSFRKKNKN